MLRRSEPDHDDPGRRRGRVERRLHRRSRTAALEDHVDRFDLLGQRAGQDVDRLARTPLGGHLQPIVVGVADPNPRCAPGPGHVGAQQADRSGAGDQHPVARLHRGLPGRPDADRQRFDQRRRLVRHRVRHRMRAMRLQDDVLREGPVDGRRGEEPDVGAQVVAAGQALHTPATGLLGLHRHPLPDRPIGHLRADGPDGAGGLMTQHQRFADDEVGDPAVVEVVHVRAADARPWRPRSSTWRGPGSGTDAGWTATSPARIRNDWVCSLGSERVDMIRHTSEQRSAGCQAPRADRWASVSGAWPTTTVRAVA